MSNATKSVQSTKSTAILARCSMLRKFAVRAKGTQYAVECRTASIELMNALYFDSSMIRTYLIANGWTIAE